MTLGLRPSIERQSRSQVYFSTKQHAGVDKGRLDVYRLDNGCSTASLLAWQSSGRHHAYNVAICGLNVGK